MSGTRFGSPSQTPELRERDTVTQGEESVMTLATRPMDSIQGGQSMWSDTFPSLMFCLPVGVSSKNDDVKANASPPDETDVHGKYNREMQ